MSDGGKGSGRRQGEDLTKFSSGYDAIDWSKKDPKDEFVFFWGNISPFSNWHRSEFTHNGTTYNCSEQFMMQQKALLFGDLDVAKKVMETTSPSKQKGLGRTIRGFDKEMWLQNAIQIMVPGLVSKFTQVPHCYEAMRATGKKTIVEASPVDDIWGIGLSETDPRAWNKDTWQGLNMLGTCLMKVRSEIWPE